VLPVLSSPGERISMPTTSNLNNLNSLIKISPGRGENGIAIAIAIVSVGANGAFRVTPPAPHRRFHPGL